MRGTIMMDDLTWARRTLAPINPEPLAADETTPTRAAAQQLLDRVLESPESVKALVRVAPSRFASSRRPPRRALLAAASAAVAAAVAGALTLSQAPAAYAATPPLLVLHGPQGPGSRYLTEAAMTVRAQRAGQSGSATLRGISWDLSTTVSGNDSSSVIVPSAFRIVTDLSGTVRDQGVKLEPLPVGDVEAQRAALRRLSAITDFPDAGSQRSRDLDPESLSDNPATAAAQLVGAADDAGNPGKVLSSASDLMTTSPLSPRATAKIYRMLASLPGITDYGTTTDRLGRPAHVVGLTSDYSGLPTKYLLLIDVKTGVPLDYEEVLTGPTGNLHLKTPAVIEYTIRVSDTAIATSPISAN
jgi:hypothetical protein